VAIQSTSAADEQSSSDQEPEYKQCEISEQKSEVCALSASPVALSSVEVPEGVVSDSERGGLQLALLAPDVAEVLDDVAGQNIGSREENDDGDGDDDERQRDEDVLYQPCSEVCEAVDTLDYMVAQPLNVAAADALSDRHFEEAFEPTTPDSVSTSNSYSRAHPLHDTAAADLNSCQLEGNPTDMMEDGSENESGYCAAGYFAETI